MRKLTIGVWALMMCACSTVEPFPINSGEVCFRCRRVIVDTRLAAQSIGSTVRSNFRTSGCLAKYLADHPEDRSAPFVTDFATGRLVPANRAIFVPTLNRDTGEQDYVAYTDQAAANAEGATRHSTPVRWDVVLEQARRAARGT